MKLSEFIHNNGIKSETVYIVGKGPSLQWILANEFGKGCIIALNEAITQVERLGLTNITFSMQKDGAIHRDGEGQFTAINECLCKKNGLSICPYGMVTPLRPATVLMVSEDNSIECYEEYGNRVSFSNKDYDLQWDEPSVLTAINVAKQLGAKKIVMLCFDSFTHGDHVRYIPHNGDLRVDSDYSCQHERMKKLLSGTEHEFVTPQKPEGFTEISHKGF